MTKPVNECLHCALLETIEAWCDEHGDRDHPRTGGASMQITDALGSLAQVMADIISNVDKPDRQKTTLAIAHRQLDECMADNQDRRIVS